MKKVLTVFLVLSIIMMFGACSDSNSSSNAQKGGTTTATVYTNEGETVTLSIKDLFNTYDSNEAKFQKLYEHAKIQFTGTIKSIKTETKVYLGPEHITSGQNMIVFEEGWCLILGQDNTNYDLANYDPGDKLDVETSIIAAPFDTDFIKGLTDDFRVLWLIGDDTINDESYSKVKTTIKIAE